MNGSAETSDKARYPRAYTRPGDFAAFMYGLKHVPTLPDLQR